MSAPELQIHDPLHAVLRHVVVVEEGVGYARDAEEEDAGRGEEEGAEVGSQGGLGDGGVDGDEGFVLNPYLANCFLFNGRGENGLTMASAMRPGRPFGF